MKFLTILLSALLTFIAFAPAATPAEVPDVTTIDSVTVGYIAITPAMAAVIPTAATYVFVITAKPPDIHNESWVNVVRGGHQYPDLAGNSSFYNNENTTGATVATSHQILKICPI